MTALVVLGTVFAIVVLGLSIPLDVALYASEVGLRGRFSWLFGLVGRDISRPGRGGGPALPPAGGRGFRRSAQDLIGLFRTEGFPHDVRCLISGVLRSSRVSQCDVYLRYGLGGPAGTGVLYAFLFPLTRYLNGLQGFRVRLEPSFLVPAFEGHASLKVRLLPIRVLPYALRFVFSPGGFRLLKYYWCHRK